MNGIPAHVDAGGIHVCERERAHPIDQAMHGSLEFWSYSWNPETRYYAESCLCCVMLKEQESEEGGGVRKLTLSTRANMECCGGTRACIPVIRKGYIFVASLTCEGWLRKNHTWHCTRRPVPPLHTSTCLLNPFTSSASSWPATNYSDHGRARMRVWAG